MSRLHLTILGSLLTLWTAVTIAWLLLAVQIGMIPADHNLWSYVQFSVTPLPSRADETLALFENRSDDVLQSLRLRDQIIEARFDLKFVLFPPLIGYGFILLLLVPFRVRRASR